MSGYIKQNMISYFIAIKDSDTLTWGTYSTFRVSRNSFPNLAEAHPAMLPKPTDYFDLQSPLA